jgi:hypothetical protein
VFRALASGAALTTAVLAGACRSKGGHESRASASVPLDASAIPASAAIADAAIATSAATADAAAAAEGDGGRGAEAVADAGATGPNVDGGAHLGPRACSRLSGPIRSGVAGALALVPTRTGEAPMLAIANASGAPRVISVDPNGALGVATDGAPLRLAAVPCTAPLPDVVFCAANDGVIRRYRLGAGGTPSVGTEVAKSRPGTRIVAASFGPKGAESIALAYLAERVTSEGLVTEAFLLVDDAPPVRVSEDGSGATFVDIAPRGDALVVLSVDGRMAMTPVHARIVRKPARGGADGERRFVLEDDAVLFVGGAAERRTSAKLAIGAPAAAQAKTFALIAVARDASEFGMAAIPIGPAPRDDTEPTWSPYPNGLDPAPIAATRSGPLVVVRTRPETERPGAMRLVELGTLDAVGAFVPLVEVTRTRAAKDVDLARETRDAHRVWVSVVEAEGASLYRFECP